MTRNKLLQASLACLLLSLFVGFACAQDPSPPAAKSISPEKQALIRELLALASSKETIDAMFKAQAEQMEKKLPEITWQAVSGMKELASLTPEQREEVRLKVLANSAGVTRRMYELFLEKIDFNQVIEDISLPLHDKYFSESELRDIVSFYKTSTGKKVIEVMPNLFAESMAQATEVLMPKIMELTRQMQDEETHRMEEEIQATVKTMKPPAKPARRTSSRHPKP